jgi:hypothetical protein
MMTKQRRFNVLALILMFVLLFTSCTGGQSEPTATVPLEPTAIPTETPVPSTPTAEPERVVWVSSIDNAETQHYSATVQALSENAGIQFQALSSLDSNQITDAIRVAVFYAPNYDISAAAAGHPNTQFVVIGNTNLHPSSNLSIIRSNAEHVLFAAGYLAEIISYDWRAVGFVASDTGLGDNAGWAFKNGGNYFCGRCSPLAPPYVQFPLVVSQPGSSPAGVWYSNYEGIAENRLNTVFIDANITDTAFYTQMANLGMTIIGSGNPPAGVEANWGATVSSDVAGTLESVWTEVIAGQSAGEVFAEITLTNVNPNLVGEGVVNFFHQMAQDLELGLIATEVQTQ